MKRSLLFLSVLQAILLMVLSVSHFRLYKKINQLESPSYQQDTSPKSLYSSVSAATKISSNSSAANKTEYLLIDPEQLEESIEAVIGSALKPYLEQMKTEPTSHQSLATAKENGASVSQAEMNSDQFYKLNEQVSYHIAQGSISNQDYMSLSQAMESASPQVTHQLMTRLAKELNEQ